MKWVYSNFWYVIQPHWYFECDDWPTIQAVFHFLRLIASWVNVNYNLIQFISLHIYCWDLKNWSMFDSVENGRRVFINKVLLAFSEHSVELEQLNSKRINNFVREHFLSVPFSPIRSQIDHYFIFPEKSLLI